MFDVCVKSTPAERCSHLCLSANVPSAAVGAVFEGFAAQVPCLVINIF